MPLDRVRNFFSAAGLKASPGSDRPILRPWLAALAILILALAVWYATHPKTLINGRPQISINLILVLSGFLPVAGTLWFAERRFASVRAIACAWLVALVGFALLILDKGGRSFSLEDVLVASAYVLAISLAIGFPFGWFVRAVYKALRKAGDPPPRQRLLLAAKRSMRLGVVPGLAFGVLVLANLSTKTINREFQAAASGDFALLVCALLCAAIGAVIIGMGLGILFFGLLSVLPAAVYRPHPDPRLKPIRWIPRFSLRFLLIATAVVALLLATAGALFRDLTEQYLVRRELIAAGARVSVEMPVDGRWQDFLGSELYQKLPFVGTTTEVFLDASVFPPEKIPAVSRLRELSWLTLRGDYENADLAPLANLESLVILAVNCPKVTDEGLAILSSLPNLTHLNLNGTGVRGTCLNRLRNAAQMRDLWLSDTRVDDDGMLCLPEMPNLDELAISNCPFGNRGAAALRRTPNVSNLDLDGTRINDEGLIHLKDCRELFELNLSRTLVRGSGLMHLPDDDLNQLELSDCPIDDRELAKLPSLQVRFLDLSRTTIGDDGLIHLAKIAPLLGSLALDQTAVTDRGIIPLARLQELARLSLNGTGVTDASLVALGRANNLADLQLNHTAVSDVGLWHLIYPAAAQLSTENSRVTRAGWDAYLAAKSQAEDEELSESAPIDDPAEESP